MPKYDHLEKDDLIRLLQRRDAERDGFYPDFIVSLRQRQTPGGIALLEIKGDHLFGKPSEVEKSRAMHREYGPVFMIGRKRGERDFLYLRALDERLQSDGAFTLDRLRHT